MRTLIIDDPEKLKVVADPLRLRLINLLTEPRTAKSLASALGVPTTRLYYHLQALEQNGFIEVVRRRLVSGIEERTYRSVAENVNVSPDLAASTLESTGVLGALFDYVHAEIAMAIELRSGAAIGQPDSGLPVLNVGRLAFGPGQLEEFSKRLNELLEEYQCPGPVPPGAVPHHILVATYPAIEPGDADAADADAPDN